MTYEIPKIPVVKTQGPLVALMIEDVSESALLAKAFRHLGILAQVFSNPDEFWQVTEREKTLCVIVDLKVMNSRERLFIDHPRIKDKSLPLILFVKESTQVLLQSAFPLFHLGQIWHESVDQFGEEVVYLGQIRSNLQRIEYLQSMREQIRDLKLDLNREKHKSKMLVSSTQRLRETREMQVQIAEALHSLSHDLPAFGMWESVARLLEKWSWIKSYSFLEISIGRRQMVSPGLQKAKYHRLPSVWLSQENRKGVSFFGQSMALQVAQEVMGERLRTLPVAAPGKEVDALVFLNVDPEMERVFDWEYFQALLGLFVVREQQIDDDLESRANVLNPWEMLTRLDQEFSENLSGTAQLYSVDFSSFSEFVRSNGKEIFFWKDFNRDLTLGLSRLLPENALMSWMKWDRLVIFVPQKMKKDIHQELKDYMDRFPYWRFCQNEDLLFTQLFTHRVKMIPISARSLISSLYAPLEKVDSDEIQDRPTVNQTRDYLEV